MTNTRTISSFDRWVLDDNGYAVGIFLDNTGTIYYFTEPVSIENVNKIGFNLTAGVTVGEGELAWNAIDQTLNLGMADGVTQQIGQEAYARVQNNTGSLIQNGKVVGFAGATSDALLVAPYLADGSSPTLYILGIMTQDLDNSGSKGLCTVWGFVRDLNTAAFAAGDILYASPTTPGGLTKVKPTAPNNVIPVAACIVSHATAGVIFVRPTIEQQKYYGTFSDTTPQAPTAIYTPKAITFNTTDSANGVSRGTPTSQIVVANAGLYKFQFSLQVESTNSSAKKLWIWPRIDGVDVPDSNSEITFSGNGTVLVPAWSWTLSMTAGQHFELMFAANSTDIFIATVAAQTGTPGTATFARPAVPSAILEVTQVQQ